ncbi:hypothetical protein V6N12_012737 [Hibiscus sabdariffa]|uniref:DNA/RNA-binding protein Alba-like domain-containing protein n=1 Tax=Hibiscus sabdariffa TaxID=183260 RepID=A0ABR2DDG7_9ROSI
MEDRESKAAPFAMDEDQGKKEQERLITRKRKRKGIPRKLVRNEKFSICESSRQNATDFFSIEDGFDMNRIGGDFRPCSLIIRAGEDIIAKLTSFCENCLCNCYIVSATGCVARADILQCGIASTHEVRSQIKQFNCMY